MPVRPIVLGVSALLLCAASSGESATFCERLAPKLSMKPARPTAAGQREWKVDLLGGLGAALFGGTAVVSFEVRPNDQTKVTSARQFADACKSIKNGISCKVEGPADLAIGTKKGEVVEGVLSGERPTVEMRKRSIYCRND